MLHESQFLRAWRDRKQDSCLAWIVLTSYIFLDLIFSCVWVSKWFVSRRKKFCSQDWRGKNKRDLTRARKRERERERDITVLPSARESRTRGEKKIHDPLIATVWPIYRNLWTLSFFFPLSFHLYFLRKPGIIEHFRSKIAQSVQAVQWIEI